MNKSDTKLFGDAILCGLSNKYKAEMQFAAFESEECSKEHSDAVLGIIKESILLDKRRSRIRLTAALVAAALLLVGCTAYVYRNQIGSFIEYIYDEYIDVELPDNSNSLEEIEKTYTLSYIPDGYELFDSMTNSVFVRHTYSNKDGDLLVFDQSLKNDSNIGIDNNGGDAEIIKHNNIEIYVRSVGDGTKNNYLWYDEYYVMNILASKSIARDEILKIIDRIE